MLPHEAFEQGQNIDIRQLRFEIKHVGQTNGNMIIEACNGDPNKYLTAGQRIEIGRCLFLIRYIGEKDGIVSMDEISDEQKGGPE
jgi:sorbitol-specific phosphotransferase system component IIA